jgi:hypothetical protein
MVAKQNVVENSQVEGGTLYWRKAGGVVPVHEVQGKYQGCVGQGYYLAASHGGVKQNRGAAHQII